MNVIEKTRELGKAIQADERYQTYMVSKKANDEDPELQDLIGRFNMKRLEVNELMRQEDGSKQLQRSNGEMRALYSQLMQHEKMTAYQEARTALNELVREVNGIIELCIEGEDPETCQPADCGGDCSGCSGCH